MPIISIEGFKVYDGSQGKFIIINSDIISECMQVYSKNNLDGVAITTSHDYKIQNIDFVNGYPEIKKLSISEGIQDIKSIHTLKNLDYILVSGAKREIDFSYFPTLKELNIHWSPHLTNMDKCKYLEDLTLSHYNPKPKDCLILPSVNWVKRLEISHSSITTFNELKEFDQLQELEFNYLNKLKTLCCLEASKKTLVSLLFNHCKSIVNHNYVSQFQNLNTLGYNSCSPIPSIDFIRKMTSLKSFRFMGTDVLDGDMTPCEGLKYAAFTNKKHFSHTMEQMKKLNTSH